MKHVFKGIAIGIIFMVIISIIFWKELKMMIQDKKTGQWYNPEKEFEALFTAKWFIAIMKRMKFLWKESKMTKTFAQWMAQVDKLLVQKIGAVAADIADYEYLFAFRCGDTPEEAAQDAIDNAMDSFWKEIKMPDEFDLVDEMQWEDLTEFLTLEEAGLEDSYIGDTVPAAQMKYYKEEGN